MLGSSRGDDRPVVGTDLDATSVSPVGLPFVVGLLRGHFGW